jgi:hypothetical protein
MNNRAFFINLMMFLLCPLFMFAQEVEVGDIFVLGKSEGAQYEHILFPRKNIIIKRGGIADMKQMAGLQVEVTAYSYDSKGNALISLRRTDGGKFFRSFREIKARYEPAIEDGELLPG